ncbi:MAG: roadblock/LC7 domain-containing protein [Polyangiaceae bacterium]
MNSVVPALVRSQDDRRGMASAEARNEYRLLLSFLAEREYSAALHLLVQARSRYPLDRALERSIRLLEQYIGSPRTRRARTTHHLKEIFSMANINESLQQLESLDGFVGASLVDSESGMVLGMQGGGDYQLELASALNTEVVSAKRRAMKKLGLGDTMEDILITLKDQYHIIRPLRNRPAVFLYLVTTRAKSNLALARMELAQVDTAINL